MPVEQYTQPQPCKRVGSPAHAAVQEQRPAAGCSLESSIGSAPSGRGKLAGVARHLHRHEQWLTVTC